MAAETRDETHFSATHAHTALHVPIG